MSFGQKMTAALLALKAEGLPPGVRTNELEKRLDEKLAALGYGRAERPSRRTFLRHLDHLRMLMLQDDVGTLCHSRNDVLSDMVAADDHQKDEHMRCAEPRSLSDISLNARRFILTVPYHHGVDEALGS